MTGTKNFIAEQPNVKILGRRLYDDKVLWLTSSAATVEFFVEATSLSFNLVGDDSAHKDEHGNPPGNCVRYSIYIDDELLLTQCMDSAEKKVVVFDNSSNGGQARKAKITFIKLTEAHQSYIGIRDIETDSEGHIKATPGKKRRIEFIGDSLTCGYGIDCKSTDEPFTTFTEDATKTYAFLTAKAVDADYSFCSYSSFGLYSGYTDNPENINRTYTLPNFYDKVTFSWNTRKYGDLLWDFNKYTPQLIVINLGTNDASYCIDDERKEKFIKAYVDFLKYLRNLYPYAYFILACGLMEMGRPMNESVAKACREYKMATGDTRIAQIQFNEQSPEEGLGSGGHPNQISQKRAAKELTDFLKQLEITI
jgi:lysophospholipase L1-like esterase